MGVGEAVVERANIRVAVKVVSLTVLGLVTATTWSPIAICLREVILDWVENFVSEVVFMMISVFAGVVRFNWVAEVLVTVP